MLQTITQLATVNPTSLSVYQERQQSPLDSLENVMLEVRRLSPQGADYLQMFYPSKQTDFCTFPERCVSGTAKELSKINSEYAKGIAQLWLVGQLFDLSEYFGGKGKFTPMQLQETAKMLYASYPYLKITEFMLFFFRFKQGAYGEFFGSADPIKLMSGLKLFLRERATIIDHLEDEKRKAEREKHAKEVVSYEEYLRMKANNQI